MQKISNNNQGQLFLLGGVILTVLIISLAVISTNVSDIYIRVDDTDYIKPDYDNIRKEFGLTLEEQLSDNLRYITESDDSLVTPIFNYVKDIFIFAQSLHGNYFNAVYDSMTFTPDGSANGITVTLTLDNGIEQISEEVTYHFVYDL